MPEQSPNRRQTWRTVSILLALLLTVGCSARHAPSSVGQAPPWVWCWAAPDGQHIAFLTVAPTTQERRRGDELWWVDTTTGRAKKLSQGTIVRASWSPDSKSIAYVRWVLGNRDWTHEVRVAELAAGSDSQLLRDVTYLGDLSWSVSGRWLAVARARPEHGADATVLLVNVGGHGDVRASWATDRGTVGLYPASSRPEDTLFFPLWYGERRNGIARVRVTLEGSIEQDTVRTEHDVRRVYPDPAGRRIAYTSPDGPETPSLEVVRLLDLRSGQETLLAPTPGLWQAAWSADGSSIALLSTDGELFTVDIRMGKRKRVAAGAGLLLEGSAPWTAAGNILFIARAGVPAVWSVGTDGSDRHMLLDVRKALSAAGEPR